MPPVQVVDMRAELKSGNRGIFSQPLVDALDGVLKRGEQAILFLNRRGTATYVFCRECGYVAKCPQCDSPLTLHVDTPEPANVQPNSMLTCHHCGYHRRVPEKCPTCGGTQIRAYGLGSEKVEAEVGALFPSARLLRWDWETTRQKDSHEIIMSHFAAHRADVLADVGLNLPDPFAPERTFSLLTQVAGRAGRSTRGGRVVLQTFQPEHYVIQSAARHDVDGFYTRELDERRKLGYPPFGRLVRLEFRHFDPLKAEAAARELAEKISQLQVSGERRQTTLIGPTPCFFSRLAGLYRWQLILRGPEPESLLRDLKLDGWRVEVDPPSLL
jgi:primosomal protein N' (replication factor Y)